MLRDRMQEIQNCFVRSPMLIVIDLMVPAILNYHFDLASAVECVHCSTGLHNRTEGSFVGVVGG